jgi:hypothetical protein
MDVGALKYNAWRTGFRCILSMALVSASITIFAAFSYFESHTYTYLISMMVFFAVGVWVLDPRISKLAASWAAKRGDSAVDRPGPPSVPSLFGKKSRAR